MSESNGCQGYIHDGYTRHGYIKAKERLHPALRFEYRPVMVQNRTVAFKRIEQAGDPRREEQIAAKTIQIHLECWDLLDHEGKTVPSHVDHILRVEPNLFQKLFGVIMGSLVSDEDPGLGDADSQKKLNDEDELAFALSGRMPGDRQQETEKNLPVG